jgi:MerR family transcriptional regulator, thiopeptide resistance regulator
MTPVTEDVRVGELARVTGLTVRTLHYYDDIGLLCPSARSSAGHRLYSAGEVDRLYRILLLRRVGLHLDEIARVLDEPGWDLATAVDRHVAQLDEQIVVAGRLRRRLAATGAALARRAGIGTAELLDTLEDMVMLDTKVQRFIPGLVYADLEAAHEYLTRVFGFEPGRLDRDGDGVVAHAEVMAGDGVIWLHRETTEFRMQSPATLGSDTAGLSVLVDDVDAHFARTRDAGATIVYEPADMPYGVREYGVRDLESRLWSFMTTLG